MDSKHFSALHVPEDSRLAIGLEKAEQERQKQKEEMRKLTIEMANRQHLEEVQQEALGKHYSKVTGPVKVSGQMNESGGSVLIHLRTVYFRMKVEGQY